MRKSRRAAILTVLAGAALAAASCSSGGGSGGNSPTATTNPATAIGEENILPPPATASQKPVYGGTLNIVGSGDVDHLDTCCAYYTTTYELLRAVSRQLISYKSTYTVPSPTQTVPDMATYTVSPDGLTYTFKIKQGVMWDAPSGARQVTSEDEVLGLKRLCNPVSPAPPLPYWENNIVGMKSFCTGFGSLKLPSAQSAEIAALKTYIDDNQISGLSTPDSSTLEITLIHPASSFINIMALPMSSPVPEEILNYLPASVQEEKNFISDGPYTITSYTPNVGYTLVKNPSWEQSTDSLRHQYFNNIKITEGENPTTIQQELEAGTADLEWDTTVPPADVESLASSRCTAQGCFVTGYVGGLTYLVFNMTSSADNGALQKVAVRKALQYCVNKRHIVQVSGGPNINVAAPHILPPQILGYQNFDPYPTTSGAGDPAKCKSMLAAAGYPNGLTLTLEYANNPPMPAQATALQSDFAAAGVTLKLAEQPAQGSYFVYIETPSNRSKWDLSFGEWFPDWQGNGAQSIMSPLFDGRLYTTGSTDYGDYNDATVNADIDAALKAPSVSAAETIWANTDRYIMNSDPGWIPLLYDALPQYIGPQIVNATFNGFMGYVDITTLWKK